MSAEHRPIPIPPRRFALRLLARFGAPLALLLGVVTTFVAMERYEPMTGVSGYVHAERFELSARESGQLVELPDERLVAMADVTKGQVLARFDDRPVQAQLAVLRAQISVTRAELQATAASLQLERADRAREQAITTQRLEVDIQELRLDVLDRRSSVETLAIELQRAEEEYRQAEQLQQRGAETAFALRLARLEQERLTGRLREERQALEEASQELRRAERRLRELPEAPDEELDALMAPLRAQVEVHEAELEALVLRLEHLELRSPVDGRIAALHRRPGESVVEGEPIVTVASPRGSHIVAWIPNRQHHVPAEGQNVRIRRLQDPVEEYRTQVSAIGAQVELIAEAYRQDPRRPELGLPVRIQLPDEFPGIPGERVDIRFD